MLDQLFGQYENNLSNLGLCFKLTTCVAVYN